MKGKDYVVKKAQETALKYLTQGSPNQINPTNTFVGQVSPDLKTITDNTTGDVYTLHFSGSPQPTSVAYKLSSTDAYVVGQKFRDTHIDSSEVPPQAVFYTYNGHQKDIPIHTVTDSGSPISSTLPTYTCTLYDLKTGNSVLLFDTTNLITPPGYFDATQDTSVLPPVIQFDNTGRNILIGQLFVISTQGNTLSSTTEGVSANADSVGGVSCCVVSTNSTSTPVSYGVSGEQIKTLYFSYAFFTNPRVEIQSGIPILTYQNLTIKLIQAFVLFFPDGTFTPPNFISTGRVYTATGLLVTRSNNPPCTGGQFLDNSYHVSNTLSALLESNYQAHLNISSIVLENVAFRVISGFPEILLTINTNVSYYSPLAKVDFPSRDYTSPSLGCPTITIPGFTKAFGAINNTDYTISPNTSTYIPQIHTIKIDINDRISITSTQSNTSVQNIDGFSTPTIQNTIPPGPAMMLSYTNQVGAPTNYQYTSSNFASLNIQSLTSNSYLASILTDPTNFTFSNSEIFTYDGNPNNIPMTFRFNSDTKQYEFIGINTLNPVPDTQSLLVLGLRWITDNKVLGVFQQNSSSNNYIFSLYIFDSITGTYKISSTLNYTVSSSTTGVIGDVFIK